MQLPAAQGHRGSAHGSRNKAGRSQSGEEKKRGEDPEWFNDFVNYNKDPNTFPKPDVDIHVSETDWIGCDYDYLIENNGTIEDLGRKIDDVLKSIR